MLILKIYYYLINKYRKNCLSYTDYDKKTFTY